MRGFIQLTSQCNMHCEYCYYNIGFLTKHLEEMTSEMVDSALITCREFACDQVQFTGGEVFSSYDLLKRAIESAREYGFFINIATNLRYVMEKGIPPILYGIDLLTISIHIDRNTRIDYLGRMVSTLYLLQNHHVAFRLIFTISKVNYFWTSRVCEVADALGVPLLLQLVHTENASEEIKQEYGLKNLTPAAIDEVIDILNARSKIDVGNKGYYENMEACLLGNAVHFQTCRAGKNSVVIKPNGDILPCFFREDLVVGNVEEKIGQVQKRMAIFDKSQRYCQGMHCLSSCL